MKNLTIILCFAISIFFTGTANSAGLESLGWKKTVDDFEGTVSYVKEGYAGFGDCKTFSVTGSIGLVQGEPKKIPMAIGLLFYGSKDSFDREGKLKIKTDSGIKETNLTCSSDYIDGSWAGKCLVVGINNTLAKHLSTTSYARLSLPSTNIDLKQDGECSELLLSVNKLTAEYLKAQE